MKKLLAAILILSACKHTDLGTSKVKHEFGETRRDGFKAFSKCQDNIPSEIRDQGDLNKKYEKAREYISNLANHIMKTNPQTFQGDLAPETFCFYVLRDDSINAAAQTPEHTIIVNDATLLYVRSDAILAATLAHELAHITMGHVNSEHPKLRKDLEYQRQKSLDGTYQSALVSEARSRSADFSRYLGDSFSVKATEDLTYSLELFTFLASAKAHLMIDAKELSEEIKQAREKVKQTLIEDSKATLNNEIMGRIDEILALELKIEKEKVASGLDLNKETLRILGPDGLSEQANWLEQEADEVGYEFYLRAGFKPDIYIKDLYDLNATQAEKDACNAAVLKFRNEQFFAIKRGTGDHPAICWRGYDIEFLEDSKHKADYAGLKKSATLESVLAGALEKVQLEIRPLVKTP